MSFSPEEIENVREIIGISSYDATATLLGNLKPGQEAATKTNILEFNKVKNSFAELKGELNTDNTAKRLAIRNRVRIRLGLSFLTSEDDLATGGAGGAEICYSHPAFYGDCD